jgi:DnaD/phage-associated family protein
MELQPHYIAKKEMIEINGQTTTKVKYPNHFIKTRGPCTGALTIHLIQYMQHIFKHCHKGGFVMAVYRQVNISFWQDPFVLDLTPEEKYFYLYLMTNSKTTQCGIYEIPKKIMIMETGYNTETIDKLLNRFSEYGKIIYSPETDEIMLLNWIKYNGSSSPKVIARVEAELKEVKNKALVQRYLELANANGYSINIVTIQYPYSIGTRSQKEKEEEKEEVVNDTLSLPHDEICRRLCNAYTGYGFGNLGPLQTDKLMDLAEEFSAEWVEKAIEKAAMLNKRNLGYVKGILQGWRADGGINMESKEKKATPEPVYKKLL